MRCAITMRYEDTGADGLFSKRFYLTKAFVDIAENRGVELIPVSSRNMVEFVSKYCDALILTGSSVDIEPYYYGQSRDDMPYFTPVDEYVLDIDLLQIFMRKPVLGICGGMQSLNVFYGGTIHRVDSHRDVSHFVCVLNDAVASIFKRRNFTVNSYHGWAVDRLGRNIVKGAVSDDGVTECIISEDGCKMAVQWHPEIMTDSDWGALFDWLQNAVRLCRMRYVL